MTNIDHRLSKTDIRIIDANGNAVANENVKIKLVNHEFLFGVGGFDSLAYVCAEDEKSKAFASDKLKRMEEVFNYTTLPFYWGMYEKNEGQPNKDIMMKAVDEMLSRNFTVKGHPLCWHTVCADWLLKYDDETIFKKQMERIYRDVADYKGKIDIWDAINEVVIMPIFDKYDNAVTRICNKYGQTGLVKAVFEAAREVNPDARLILNDFNTSYEYEDLIERCLDAGVDISYIGIQSHQHQGYWGKDKLYDVLERFSRFNLPIHFTENTFVSGDLIPEYIEDLNDWQVDEWPSTIEGEERQKNQMEEMYRILFADKNVTAITGWDLCDGGWLKAPSGILRIDNSVKPAYEMLKHLIKEEWTTDITVKTNENGALNFEGFRGDYEISVKGLIKSAKLCDNTKEIVLQI